MRIISDDSNQILIDTKLGKITPKDMLDILVAKDGRKLSRIEADAGLYHPMLAKSPTIKSILIAMETLGYEVVIRKMK